MANLNAVEKSKLEKLFGMSSGYVLHFSDRTFNDFFVDFEIDIHGEKYQSNGTSKANKLRTFWSLESDYLVGQVISRMIDSIENPDPDKAILTMQCREIVSRLLSGKVDLGELKATAATFDLHYMDKQIKRMEQSIESDPELAIGTAKELIETCCKTILRNLSIEFCEKNDDLIKLVRLTMDQLKILPNSIDSNEVGADIIKKILGNLSVIAQGIAELRNKFGTGHGKHGDTAGLTSKHARLAVGATAVLVRFLFETHIESNSL